MTRLYLRIFLTFWCISATIIISSNLVIHWLEINPDNYLQLPRSDRDYDPGRRLLDRIAGSAINRNSAQVMADMQGMPAWSLQAFYVVDANNEDLLGRPLPEGSEELVQRLNPSYPSDKYMINGQKVWGRHVTLNDGKSVKILTLEPSSGDIVWQLFISNIWPLLLISVLVSGTACFFVARYLAHGLSTLQKATRTIASGDLSVRISKRFHQRGDEIASLAYDFDHMTERLEKAMTEQKRLIKDVSHELRTPLARLQVALALARQRSGGIVERELDRIQQAADYLNDVISDILALPVLDTGSWALDDTVDLIGLLQSLQDLFAGDLERQGIRLRLDHTMDEALVATHGNMLRGVFENVLRNALHYTPPGGEITVIVSDKTHSYQIDVCDTGPGVANNQTEDIFQPFYRTDEARDRKTGGYGLGLAIAQRTIALHQGSIRAYNQPHGGLCISIILNYMPAAEA
ncbi:MAG TPA: ATP-binding protein [Cellvibrionaceae bacterium]